MRRSLLQLLLGTLLATSCSGTSPSSPPPTGSVLPAASTVAIPTNRAPVASESGTPPASFTPDGGTHEPAPSDGPTPTIDEAVDRLSAIQNDWKTQSHQFKISRERQFGDPRVGEQFYPFTIFGVSSDPRGSIFHAVYLGHLIATNHETGRADVLMLLGLRTYNRRDVDAPSAGGGDRPYTMLVRFGAGFPSGYVVMREHKGRDISKNHPDDISVHTLFFDSMREMLDDWDRLRDGPSLVVWLEEEAPRGPLRVDTERAWRAGTDAATEARRYMHQRNDQIAEGQPTFVDPTLTDWKTFDPEALPFVLGFETPRLG